MSANKFATVFDNQPNNDQIKTETAPENIQSKITNILPNIPNIDCLFDPEAKDGRGILLRHLDPRPDLAGDHESWMTILNNALLLDGLPENLYGTLYFLRCSGAGLEEVDSELGYKLVQGQWDAGAAGCSWDAAKKRYLESVRDGLISLFKFSTRYGSLPAPGEIFDQVGRKEPEGSKRLEGEQEKQQQQRLIFGVIDPHQFRNNKKK